MYFLHTFNTDDRFQSVIAINIKCSSIQEYKRSLQNSESYADMCHTMGLWGIQRIAQILAREYDLLGRPDVKTQKFTKTDMETVFRHLSEGQRIMERTLVFKEELLATM